MSIFLTLDEEDEEEKSTAVVETDFDFQDFVLRSVFFEVHVVFRI